MNLDALWTIDYATNHGDFGNGVVVLVGGNIYGGDMNHYYQGSYSAGEDGAITGRVTMHVHPDRAAPPCAQSREFTVVFSGRPVDGELEINGTLEHEPLTRLFVHMSRQSAVPVFQDSGMNPHGEYRDQMLESCVDERAAFGQHGYEIEAVSA